MFLEQESMVVGEVFLLRISRAWKFQEERNSEICVLLSRKQWEKNLSRREEMQPDHSCSCFN